MQIFSSISSAGKQEDPPLLTSKGIVGFRLLLVLFFVALDTNLSNHCVCCPLLIVACPSFAIGLQRVQGLL